MGAKTRYVAEAMMPHGGCISSLRRFYFRQREFPFDITLLCVKVWLLPWFQPLGLPRVEDLSAHGPAEKEQR